VIYATFRDKLTNKPFTFSVTHFDHLGKIARTESAKLLMEKVPELSGGNPVIITGDFNTEPDECGTISYRNLTETYDGIEDIRSEAQTVLGKDGSWRGWSYDSSHAKQGEEIRLDHIFLSKDIKVQLTAVIDDQIKESFEGYESVAYPSDHLPIIADLTL
jgi:endonuclease/exonuclease/phosphatase family metal-dependent hydrolase